MRVVKIGGRVQGDAALTAALADMWRADPRTLCIVHGGGDEVSTLQRALGREPAFSTGRRVTSLDDIELLRMVLSGAVNKRLVASLVSAGVPAVGISGEDAALLRAGRWRDSGLGEVGSPGRVESQLLEHLLAGGYLPVISPLARAEDGGGAALNVNGDDAAAAIAVALSAGFGETELIFISDVPGVLLEGAPVPMLDHETISALVGAGVIADGMTAKLEAALAALDAGVESARIGDVSSLRDATRGTVLTPSRSLA